MNYRSVDLSGGYNITMIRKLENDKVDWFWTMRLTILRPYGKGMILHYNQFDDLFIYPEKPLEFIYELQKINPSIEIINKSG